MTDVYDQAAHLIHWTSWYRLVDRRKGVTRRTRIAVRFTFPPEPAALLHYNGDAIVRQYGDGNLDPLTAASRSLIVDCRLHSSKSGATRG